MAQLKAVKILNRMSGWNEHDKLDVFGDLTVSQEIEDRFNEVSGMPS